MQHLITRFENGEYNFSKYELGAKDETYTFAHYLANHNYPFDTDDECMTYLDNEGVPVAHHLARNGYQFTTTYKYLELRDAKGNTTAHVMAKQGFIFPLDFEGLVWRNHEGDTVAHIEAAKGTYYPKEHEVYAMTNKKGESVGDVYNHYKRLIDLEPQDLDMGVMEDYDGPLHASYRRFRIWLKSKLHFLT